jgi:hypothetical protein
MTSERSIGGEIEASLGMLHGTGGAGVWPLLGQTHELRCDTGRSALKLALLDWVARRPGASLRVWLPSYVCASVADAVAQLGLPLARYACRPGDSGFEPPAPGANDVVVVVHYFGLLNEPALAWLAQQQGRAFGVIEDCVQAPYTQDAGAAGDYAIASLRKWWPAPDGALVRARLPLAVHALPEPDEGYVSRRAIAKLARGQYVDDAVYLGWVEESEELLQSSVPRQMSWLSERLLEGVDAAEAKQARRANWSELAAGLAGQAKAVPLFATLPASAAPLAFPLLMEDGLRDGLRRFLAGRRMFCPVHWPLPEDGTAAKDLLLSRRLLSLPLDQRYGVDEMRSLASAVVEYFERDDA